MASIPCWATPYWTTSMIMWDQYQVSLEGFLYSACRSNKARVRVFCLMSHLEIPEWFGSKLWPIVDHGPPWWEAGSIRFQVVDRESPYRYTRGAIEVRYPTNEGDGHREFCLIRLWHLSRALQGNCPPVNGGGLPSAYIYINLDIFGRSSTSIKLRRRFFCDSCGT